MPMVQDIRSLKHGDTFRGDFVIFEHNAGTLVQKNNLPYLDIGLRGDSGELETRLWREDIPLFAAFTRGQCVHVEGKITISDKYGMGFKPTSAKLLRPDHPVRKYMNRVAEESADSIKRRFREAVALISGPRANAWDLFLRKFFETGCSFEDYFLAPAAKGHHHAYIHGLPEHSIEVALTAHSVSMLPAYSEIVDRGLLIVAALLHDVGKVPEYVYRDRPIDLSFEGMLLGHMALGHKMVVRVWEKHRDELEAAGLRERDVALLAHIIYSHHGEAAKGSPVDMLCPEAILIHYADEMSAKLNKMVGAIRQGTMDERGVIKSDDREFWKGIVCSVMEPKEPEKRGDDDLMDDLLSMIPELKAS